MNDRIRMIYKVIIMHKRKGLRWISGQTMFTNRWLKEKHDEM